MRGSHVLVACLVAAPCLGQRGFDHLDLDAHAKQELGHHHPVLKSGSPEWGYDIRYHRLEVTLDPGVNAIAGTVTTYFSATEDLDLLRFDASEMLTVDQVLHHGTSIPFSQVSDDLLEIELPSTLAAGQLDSLTVSYSGSPAGSGLGSFVLDVHEGIPVLWTLSEPYGAKDWWPCKQDLNDKIDSLDLLVTTPNAYRAAGNGVLINELVNGGETTWHWRHRHPIAYYLIATAVTNYEVSTFDIELPGATVPMVVYSYPEDAFFMELNAGDVLQQMPLFSELFGLYPYADEKYGHAQFSWGGGMEHQTMSFMGYFSYELAAHELAHQWFGDKVTCGSWEDLWLNEGFATYLTGLCYDFIATQYWAGWKQGSVDYITSEPDGSVLCPDTNDLDRLFDPRLTYRKGALVLHMLRWVCGDSAFFAGCRNYLDDPALQLVGAHTSDLQQHLEVASGLDLNEFLADWFVGEGHPSYTVEWAQDMDGNVTLALHQTTSHPSVDFFEMPVPIRFKNALEDSTVVLDHTFSGQEFSFHLPFEADSALFDPETWLISRENLVVSVPGGLRTDEHALIYPMPVQEQATIHVGSLLSGKVGVVIHDASGRTVLQRSVVVSGQRVPLDLSALGAGWYMLELRNAEQAVQLRFVKE